MVALEATEFEADESSMVPVETDDASMPSPFTTEDALRIAGDTQARLVRGPDLTGWGRLWWLARMAQDQSRLFSPVSERTPESAIATVDDE